MNTLPAIEVEELEVEHITITAPRVTVAQMFRQAIEEHKARANLAGRVRAARVAVCNQQEG